MGKIAKYQKKDLDSVLRNMNRAISFIEQERIAVCRRDTSATTTLHYTRDDGNILYEITKDDGSNLVGIRQARRELQLFQEQNA